MKYNVLNITTIYAILIAWASLMITACPEPDKPTTKRETTKGTKTGPFTVTFNLNDGNGDMPPLTVPKGEMATKPKNNPTYPDPKNPTKDKFDFGEWYQDKARKVPFFFDTPITQNLTLYAGWNKPNEFTVRFHPNGGGGVAEQIIALNGKATRPTPPPPPTKNRQGITFDNWYTDRTFLAPPFEFATETITKNTIIYARWIYTVTFDTNGGTPNNIKEQTIKDGAKATKPENPTKTGFAFVGWYTDKELTTAFDITTDTITKNTTLYAGWGYTVSFNTNGGSAIDNQPLLSGSKATKPENPTKTSFAFVGWYTDNVPTTASTPFKFATTKITKHTTLYAGWGFAVSFNTNGGSAIANQPLLSGSKATKPKNNPTKASGIFDNWYTDEKLTTPFKFATETITKHITLYAGWVSTWKAVATGYFHTVGIQTDGTLWAWGGDKKFNKYDQLGLGDNKKRTRPTKVGTAKWKAVDAGTFHTVGIKADGTLWAWGGNANGQLGMGNKIGQPRPTKVGTAKWKAVDAMFRHTVGIKEDGTLWAWGKNDKGQLGLGDTGNRNSPTKVGTASWKAVYTAQYHTVGIKADDTLWAWGYNGMGQIGNGRDGFTIPHSLVITEEKETRPVRVGSAKWKAVAAGWRRTVGIQTDNTLWAWGYNSKGYLGTGGNKSNKTRPTKVGTATGWSMVFAGDDHAFGIQDGTLWAWGTDNKYSQIGFGYGTNKTRPTQVGTAKWKTIAAAQEYTVGIQTDDTLWAWGKNTEGQLGLGHTKNRPSPTLVK